MITFITIPFYLDICTIKVFLSLLFLIYFSVLFSLFILLDSYFTFIWLLFFCFVLIIFSLEYTFTFLESLFL